MRSFRRWFSRLLLIVFLAAMAVLPIPVVLVLAAVVDPLRKNLPAELLKKKKR